MNYQERMVASICMAFVMLGIVFGAMMVITSCREQRFPNILETQPDLSK